MRLHAQDNREADKQTWDDFLRPAFIKRFFFLARDIWFLIIQRFGHKGKKRAFEREEYIKKCCGLPIENKKLVFYSFGTYSDHGKYITEALLKTEGGGETGYRMAGIGFDA